MIQANELRIGNILHYNVGETTPEHEKPVYDWEETTIDWQDIRWCQEGKKGFNQGHRPIPLTEEWLVEFGFYQQTDGGYYNDCRLIVKRCGQWFDNGMGTEIQFVHQLQNLYFAITNQELCRK